MLNIHSLLSELSTRLAAISDTPELDASVLLAHIVNKPRTWVMAHPELTFPSEQQKKLDEALARLENGDPFPYVIGHWEFFGLDFEVTPDVLIPRPETELLVEKAIAWLQANPQKRSLADIGTGSGVIAISIAKNISDVTVLATDISSKALAIAQRNAEKHGVSHRIRFVECDLLPQSPTAVHSSLIVHPSSFDLLCANLPYIPTETLRGLPIYEREPTLALDGGRDGLDLFRRLLEIAPAWLAPNSLILLEIEATLGMQAVSLAYDSFAEATIHLHKDLTGRDRLLEIML